MSGREKEGARKDREKKKGERERRKGPLTLFLRLRPPFRDSWEYTIREFETRLNNVLATNKDV